MVGRRILVLCCSSWCAGLSESSGHSASGNYGPNAPVAILACMASLGRRSQWLVYRYDRSNHSGHRGRAVPLGLAAGNLPGEFILAFAVRVPLLPTVLLFIAILFLGEARLGESPVSLLAITLGGLAVACTACHGTLASLAPKPERSGLFYLFIAFGGVLGSLGSGLLAP